MIVRRNKPRLCPVFSKDTVPETYTTKCVVSSRRAIAALDFPDDIALQVHIALPIFPFCRQRGGEEFFNFDLDQLRGAIIPK
jgi:hypothetical protein